MTALPTPLDPATEDVWGAQINAALAAIEDRAIEAQQAVASLEQQIATQLSGIELGYAERVTTFSTTNTSTASGGGIPGLALSLTGQGRPVDVEFYVSTAYHSVASTQVFVNLAVAVNGGAASTTSEFSQSANVRSTATTTGPSLVLRRRVLLVAGSSYVFTVNLAGGAAGTSTLAAASFAPITLSATSR